MDQILVKHKKLVQLIENINSITTEFNGMVFFKDPSLKVSFNSYEVCFKDYVLYLYSVFIELPGVNLKFVESKIKDFQVSMSEKASQIYKIVQSLRTVRGHWTSVKKLSDLEKRNYCEDWYKDRAGVLEPETEQDYKKCIISLLDDTIEYLTNILQCIHSFNKNEFCDVIKEEWERQVERNFGKYEWQVELITILELYGMNHYDSMEIVDKQLSKWSAKLKLLQDGFVFQNEARKIIESYLQEEDLWPADANDLIGLGVPKGPGLREMIIKAKQLYYEGPCPKDEFLRRFKERYRLA